MEFSEDIQAVNMHVVIQAATVAVRFMREADPTTEPHTRRNSPEEPQGQGKLDQI